MNQVDQTESGMTISNPNVSIQSWQLDRNTVIRAARHISEIKQLNRDPEDYFDDTALRAGIHKALTDPQFPE